MTAQMREGLILNGEATSMASCPPLPHGHPRLVEPSADEDIWDPEGGFRGISACWRGYVGTWEIRDGRFYLVAVSGRFTLREGEPILADWFSGVLCVPKGALLRYVHMGFGSVYEQELQIRIERGLVVTTQVIDNRKRYRKQWIAEAREAFRQKAYLLVVELLKPIEEQLPPKDAKRLKLARDEVVEQLRQLGLLKDPNSGGMASAGKQPGSGTA